jgi:hypothetical protein
VARHQPDGTLTYTFVESLKATYPYYLVRLLGGADAAPADQPLLPPDAADAHA